MRAFRVMRTLFKRDFLYSLYSLGYYVALFVSFIASSFILKNFLDSIGEEDILVSAYPLNYPLYITLIIISLYLVILSGVSISREREQGTLEVLFYGPVTPGSFLWGKYLKDLCLGIVALGFTALYFYLVSLFTNLGFTTGLIKALIMSIFLLSCVVSFGLFISSLTGRIRSSVLALVAILGAFLAIQLGYNALLGFEKESLSVPMLYVRQAMSYVFRGISWISPFAYLSRGLDSVVLENPLLYVANIGYAVAYSLVFMVLSVYVMSKKGVRA
ncbi:MAG: ABC transporter permease [Candidatus Caldatribacterium sp.]|uniref:ABC transporter permease n=1 Tax=Candidatus Caldatribacterium sp. TaxID=2282143 RepID=UPI00299269D6|nr:ABC transporter permease [Candidatus Caldatribacterium sp.]MCX7730641.1 ABC transporter permease [Candidatus Caldatribacterium sp.]MDW8080351.1 ABC transporter permease subunit [Candidatus Calescibacterium sp.]